MSERLKDTISIVIADKSPLVQSGLAGIFAKDGRFTLLASAADGERFMAAVRRAAWCSPSWTWARRTSTPS